MTRKNISMFDKNAKACSYYQNKFNMSQAVRVIYALFIFSVIVSMVSFSCKQSSTTPQTPPKAAAKDDAFIKMTAAEHLAEAKKALAENYKPNKDPMKTTWGMVAKARKHLEAIGSDAPEHEQAANLMKEVTRREKEIDRISKIVAQKLLTQERKKFAEEYERSLLDKGMDVHVDVLGKENTTLKIKWVLVSRPLVHKLINDESFIGNLRKRGFQKLICSDGYNSSWTVDLK